MEGRGTGEKATEKGEKISLARGLFFLDNSYKIQVKRLRKKSDQVKGLWFSPFFCALSSKYVHKKG